LLDRQNLVSRKLAANSLRSIGPIESATTDAFAWLKQSAPAVELMLANLFLHHFPDELLGPVAIGGIENELFIACEPRRSPLALAASRCLRLIGCNSITQHDAVRRCVRAFWPRTLRPLASGQ